MKAMQMFEPKSRVLYQPERDESQDSDLFSASSERFCVYIGIFDSKDWTSVWYTYGIYILVHVQHTAAQYILQGRYLSARQQQFGTAKSQTAVIS